MELKTEELVLSNERLRPMQWQDGTLHLLDQRLLPHLEIWMDLKSWQDVETAIKSMAVRGAPAIGIAAAYGIVLAIQSGDNLKDASQGLIDSRPTAVNLKWAVDRMMSHSFTNAKEALQLAQQIEFEDLEMNLAIGANGTKLVPSNANILTICNTGAIATAGHGTALGIIRTAHSEGKNIHVWSCETRPRQQGLKLTAWELQKENIPFKSIADSAAAMLMAQGKVDLVIAGADRIAKNGDSANKIGTLSLAVLANHYKIPFYIAAPASTFDLNLENGTLIPIEERTSEELTMHENIQVAPVGIGVYNPGFDVTPGTLISAIITEKGIYRSPYHFQ